MRISDWSSDVCSSDLGKEGHRGLPAPLCRPGRRSPGQHADGGGAEEDGHALTATHRFARPHGLAAAGVEGAAGNCDIRSVDVSDDFWTDAGVSIIAVLALPFYLGYIHAPIATTLQYAIVAGIEFGLGERP